MNIEKDKLPKDPQLSSLYKQTEQDIPATHIDDSIIAAAKQESRKYSLPYNPFSNNWHIPASLAAVLVLSVTIVSLMEDVENDLASIDGVPPLTISEFELFQTPEGIIDKIDMMEEKTSLAKKPSKTIIKSRAKALAQKPETQNLLASANNGQLEKSKKQQSSISVTRETARSSLTATMPLSTPIINITTGTDEQAMLPYWQYQNNGLSIRLIQRLPDQTRGYFVARGFTTEHAELIAQSCVFQTIFKNISDKGQPSEIVYNMDNWVVTHHGKAGEMKTREKWAAQWQQLNVTTSAKLAFKWGLLPTTQDYQPGDYNWGMAIFDLSPADSFTLKLTWQQYGQQHHVSIANMQCAADIHADPETP